MNLNKCALLGALLGMCFPAFSQEREILPHISEVATTREKGKLNFYRPAGLNAHSSFFLNSLSYALSSRFELGTSPLWFAYDRHLFNLSMKWNFYKGKDFQWAWSMSGLSFDLTDELGTGAEASYTVGSQSLILNYLAPFWDLNFSLFGTFIFGELKAKGVVAPPTEKTEWGLDVSRKIRSKYLLTLSFGQLREKGYSPFEEVECNIGLAGGMKFPGSFLSRPALGFFYVPERGGWSLRFSTTFY